MRSEFLPRPDFGRLRDSVLAHAAPAREMLQGDTITRRFAIDPEFIAHVPEIKTLLSNLDWRGLNRYVGSVDQEPLTYVQTILSRIRDSKPDPQTDLHIDTFHPTVKAFYFLTDVAEDEGPFVYVPGSHRLTPGRLQWEYEQSIGAATSADPLAARGSLRVDAAELAKMGFGPPRAFAVPANTLVIADTVGFHARGFSARPSIRVEIWTYGRRNPFLPWAGLDPSASRVLPSGAFPSFGGCAIHCRSGACWRSLGRMSVGSSRKTRLATELSGAIRPAAREPSRPHTSSGN